MQYSFLGFSTLKMRELNLDVKDMIILRYFVDFKDSGKMLFEIVNGRKYYWINYKTMEEEMPHLELGKKAIMKRMHKLRDMGILDHYTKKEGGTFSYFALGVKYFDLITKTSLIKNEFDNKEEKAEEENLKKKESIGQRGEIVEIDKIDNESKEPVINYVQPDPKKEEGLSSMIDKGCLSKSTAKINLLNDFSAKEIDNNIKKAADEIIEYLNSKINAKYNPSSYRNIKLIKSRLKEGYSISDFKEVIDKKAEAWLGTEFEQYLTPQTLFGAKFEIYLNQKILPKAVKNKISYEAPKLRFNNFKSREYDYDALERKLLGWN